MPLYLTVSQGTRADTARPILASNDPRLIAAVMRETSHLGDLLPEEHTSHYEDGSRPERPLTLVKEGE